MYQPGSNGLSKIQNYFTDTIQLKDVIATVQLKDVIAKQAENFVEKAVTAEDYTFVAVEETKVRNHV